MKQLTLSLIVLTSIRLLGMENASFIAFDIANKQTHSVRVTIANPQDPDSPFVIVAEPGKLSHIERFNYRTFLVPAGKGMLQAAITFEELENGKVTQCVSQNWPVSEIKNPQSLLLTISRQ